MSKQGKHKITGSTVTVSAACNNRLISHKLFILMPTAAVLGILALVAVLFASADAATNSYATSVESEVTAEIDGTHYVTLSAPDVNFSISPTTSAQLSKQNINVDVETNAVGGADLYLSMSGDTNALHLNGDPTNTAPAIEATASPVAANGLAANTWGYSTDDQTYSAVPTANSDPALLAAVDGESVGSNAGGVITASVPVYFAASVDTSIPSGSYSNRVTYSAVVDGGIITSATLTKIEVGGETVENMQPEVENTLEITTNLMTNTYGTPRVYYETANPAGYQECGDVTVGRNESGYMMITCKVTPTQAATGVTLHIVPKGDTNDKFCIDGTYTPDTSDCEAGEWKWGSFVIDAPDIVSLRNMSEISTMQEMTPEFCASVTTSSPGNTARLRDTRDGKYYWVAKLADGNCWMTQNLDLDLSGRILTPSDSDVSSNWRYNGSWYTSASQISSSSTAIQSWDLGEYVKTEPTNDDGCGMRQTTDLSACTAYFTSVSGLTPYTEAVNEGKLPEENVAVQGGQYDAHFLVGNYYSWGAATASSGNNIADSGYATDSICPAGWQLPNSGDNTTNGSFGYLLSRYGLDDSYAADNYNITTSPLYFVLSGNVNTSYNLYSAGGSGYYRTRRAYSSSDAYYLLFFSTEVDPSAHNFRSSGFSVRCVADWE